MAAIKTYSESEKQKAKKAGFKAKAPKKPKASSSLTTLENWVDRYNVWVDKLKAKAKAYDKKEADKKKKASLLTKIRSAKR